MKINKNSKPYLSQTEVEELLYGNKVNSSSESNPQKNSKKLKDRHFVLVNPSVYIILVILVISVILIGIFLF